MTTSKKVTILLIIFMIVLVITSFWAYKGANEKFEVQDISILKKKRVHPLLNIMKVGGEFSLNVS